MFGGKAGKKDGFLDESKSELTQQFKSNFSNWLKVVSDQNAHRYKLEGVNRYGPQDIYSAINPPAAVVEPHQVISHRPRKQTNNLVTGLTLKLDRLNEDQENPKTIPSQLETIPASNTVRSVDTTAQKRRTRNPGSGSPHQPEPQYRVLVDENNDSVFMLQPNKNGQFTLPSRSLIVPTSALPLKNFMASPATHTKLQQMHGQKAVVGHLQDTRLKTVGQAKRTTKIDKARIDFARINPHEVN